MKRLWVGLCALFSASCFAVMPCEQVGVERVIDVVVPKESDVPYKEIFLADDGQEKVERYLARCLSLYKVCMLDARPTYRIWIQSNQFKRFRAYKSPPQSAVIYGVYQYQQKDRHYCVAAKHHFKPSDRWEIYKWTIDGETVQLEQLNDPRLETPQTMKTLWPIISERIGAGWVSKKEKA